MSLHDIADACIQLEWNRFVAKNAKELEDLWALEWNQFVAKNAKELEDLWAPKYLEPVQLHIKPKPVELHLKPKLDLKPKLNLKPAVCFKTNVKKPKRKRPILAFSKAKKSHFITKVSTIKRTRIPWKSSIDHVHLESLISLINKDKLF